MADEKPEKLDGLAQQTPKKAPSSSNRKSSRALLILFLVFIIFVVIILLTQNREQIDWKDYNTGIELAKQQNKPALLCFFKQYTHFSSDMWQNVYNKPTVKKYVEANFIPILIDVDKQPEIARRYKVTYYPTHYVENPNTNQRDGPFLGESRLLEFIKKPRSFTQKNSSLQ